MARKKRERHYLEIRRVRPLGYFRGGISYLRSHPIISFAAVLLLLFLLIVLSNTVFKPKAAPAPVATAPKNVDVYAIGTAPKLTLQAQVEKSKVLKITALSGGVVQSINFNEGDNVTRGQTLVVLSSNYQGGNALSLSRQIAANQYNNVNDTFTKQKEIIARQRDLANRSADNANQLRDITNQSIGDTQSVIDLNNNIISSLDAQINSAPNDAAAVQFRQLKSQFQSANLQLTSSLRNAQFNADSSKPPAQIAEITKDVTLKQLEIQEKGLELSKEVARLQLALAQVTEATMYPGAPLDGTVQRIHVKIGQSVSPGTPLMTISGGTGNSNLYVKVSQEIANSISKLEPSVIHLGNKDVELFPDFISSEATDGQLYVIHYFLPDNWGSNLTDLSYINVDIPIGYPSTGSAIPYVPLDAVFQGQDNSYLFVVSKDAAESKEVKLGQVFGRFVEVRSGLKNGDQIILNRNIVAGDKVKKGGG